MQNDFAVFILTYQRADNVLTYDTLRKQGYTGQIYLIVDDTDEQIEEYKGRYREQVIVFSKQAAIDITDTLDNFDQYNSVVFARNYSFTIAKELGLTYFLQLDDDYGNFYNCFDNEGKYITAHQNITSLDSVFEMVLDFFIDSGADSVCLSQGGDFVGGPDSTMGQLGAKGKWSRKAMNSFFLSADRPFKFMGRINEDVNAYTSLGNIGKKFFTIPRLRLSQARTQKSDGGLTDIYLDVGTYVKSFYSVMVMPSSISVSQMGVKNMRLHHSVQWKYTVPEIVSEDFKKA